MQLPTIQNLLLCDQVLWDKITNKQTLVGVFDNFNSIVFPFSYQYWLYLVMTGGSGKVSAKITLEHLDTGHSGCIGQGDWVFNDELASVCTLEKALTKFEVPGNYEFALKTMNNKTFATRRFRVTALAPPPGFSAHFPYPTPEKQT
jgi:hypothetical protein